MQVVEAVASCGLMVMQLVLSKVMYTEYETTQVGDGVVFEVT